MGNLAGDSINTRDLLWETSLPKILIELFTQGTIILRLLRTAVWTLSNLFRGLPFPDPAQVYIYIYIYYHIDTKVCAKPMRDTGVNKG